MDVFVNNRRQHAVGQGFFHSSHLFEESELRLRFVYDCGAMAMYASAREARIDQLLGAVGAGARLDILFLSHVHADHINGVTRLLDPAGGLRADTIVLPLINVADRLIGYARVMV
jgi:glyoxylase-like metal-dependent hydrolase (beta-lactamase superfamily II)